MFAHIFGDNKSHLFEYMYIIQLCIGIYKYKHIYICTMYIIIFIYVCTMYVYIYIYDIYIYICAGADFHLILNMLVISVDWPQYPAKRVLI